MQKHTINLLFRAVNKSDGGKCVLCKRPPEYAYAMEGNKNWYYLCDSADCFAHFELNDRVVICREEMPLQQLPLAQQEMRQDRLGDIASLVTYSNLKLKGKPKHKEPALTHQQA